MVLLKTAKSLVLGTILAGTGYYAYDCYNNHDNKSGQNARVLRERNQGGLIEQCRKAPDSFTYWKNSVSPNSDTFRSCLQLGVNRETAFVAGTSLRRLATLDAQNGVSRSPSELRLKLLQLFDMDYSLLGGARNNLLPFSVSPEMKQCDADFDVIQSLAENFYRGKKPIKQIIKENMMLIVHR